MAEYKIQGRLAKDVTPSDTELIPNPSNSGGKNIPCALFVGVAGNIRVLCGGNDVTFSNVSGFLPIEVTKVFSTDTTATNIIALW